MHGVAERLLRPMCVDGGVFRDLRVPVEQRAAVGSGVPAVEGVAVLGGLGRESRHLAVLCDVFLGLVDRRGVFAINVGDGERRRSPLGIEDQVGRRHGAEGVRRGQSAVGIPAAEGVVGVNAALSCSGRPHVRRLVDVCVELDVLDGVELRAAVVIINIERVAIVVEVIFVNIASPSASLFIVGPHIGIPNDIFRLERTASCCYGLTVSRRFRVLTIICILQPIINIYLIRRITPLRYIRNT